MYRTPEMCQAACEVYSHITPYSGGGIIPRSCVGELRLGDTNSSMVAASVRYSLDSCLHHLSGTFSTSGQARWLPGWESTWGQGIGKGWRWHEL